MKFIFFIATFVCLFFAGATAQNNVGVGTTTPAASSVLDVQSTTQGMLVPRMTQAQRNLIATPATGLLVYQTDNTPGFYFYNGSWTGLSSSGTATQALNMGNNNITNANTITTSKLNTSEFSIGATNTIITLGGTLTGAIVNNTSSDVNAAGKTYILLTDNLNYHAIHGIAGGYDGKILYVGLTLGNYLVGNSTTETIATNRISEYFTPLLTQNDISGSHLIKLLYMNVPNVGLRWVVIDTKL